MYYYRIGFKEQYVIIETDVVEDEIASIMLLIEEHENYENCYFDELLEALAEKLNNKGINYKFIYPEIELKFNC